MSQAEDKTATLLATLWIKGRPLVEERLNTLDQASAAASAGALTDEKRKEGASSAHKLAGSLGMTEENEPLSFKWKYAGFAARFWTAL